MVRLAAPLERREWTFRAIHDKAARHELEHLRPRAALDHLGREPRAGAGRGGRRLPAGAGAERGGHPAVPRRAPAGHQQVHHPAAGARRGADPVGHVRGQDHRHADQPDDRERRPALEGLFGGRQGLSPRPRRLRLRRQVRLPRLSRRRAQLGARDRGAGGGGRGGAAGDPRGDDHRLCRRDRRRRDRPRDVRRGRDRQQPVLLPRCRGRGERWEKLVDEARQAGSSLGAVVECVATGVPAGWGAPIYAKLDADLAARDDGHQRGQGRRDRRRLRRGAAARRAERRPDAAGRRRARSSSPTTRAGSPAASRPASRWWCAWRSSRPARS